MTDDKPDAPTTYARVGLRLHWVAGEPMYTGQPEVSMCGTVFIRDANLRPDDLDDLPTCYDCAVRDVDRMRFEADHLLIEADVAAASLRRAGATLL